MASAFEEPGPSGQQINSGNEAGSSGPESDNSSEENASLCEESFFTHYDLVRLGRDLKDIIAWLQEKKLLSKGFNCPKCDNEMKLYEDSNCVDGHVWRCRRTNQLKNKRLIKVCDTRFSVRKDSWFGESPLLLADILQIIYFFVYNIPQTFVAQELHVGKPTVVNWYWHCREVAFDAAILTSEAIGGPGVVVEIDESKFGKRKFNKGRRVEGQWVFGGVDTKTKSFFMVPVERRNAETLIPLIQTWIKPGSIINSDCWKSYDELDTDPDFTHFKVNHTYHFKDPVTGVHKNRIEGLWAHAKRSLPPSGRRKNFIPGYLATTMFRSRAKAQGRNAFLAFLEAASTLHCPNPEPF